MQKAVCRTVPADRHQNIRAYCAIARTSEKVYETIAAQIRDYKSSNKTPFNAKQENRAQAGKLQTTSRTTLPIQQSRKATKPLNNYPLTQVKQLTKHYGANPPQADILKPLYTVASACSRSASKSSVDSMPQLKRTRSGEIPQATSSSSFIWRCVALAGCSTHVRASATCVAI